MRVPPAVPLGAVGRAAGVPGGVLAAVREGSEEGGDGGELRVGGGTVDYPQMVVHRSIVHRGRRPRIRSPAGGARFPGRSGIGVAAERVGNRGAPASHRPSPRTGGAPSGRFPDPPCGPLGARDGPGSHIL